MTVALMMDHHVPAAIPAGLRLRGVDILTAREDGSHQLEDERLLQRSTQLGRVLFTQDRDFLRITSQCLQDGHEFAGVVYAPQLAISIGDAIRDLELIALASDPDDLRNRVECIPFP